MYTIEKTFEFSASHRLQGLPADHQCARLHGHNYRVVVRLMDNGLDSVGMVFDYGRLAPFKKWLDATLDHQHLNDAAKDAGNPTAERLAAWLHEAVRGTCGPFPEGALLEVGVSETPKTWAWYSPT